MGLLTDTIRALVPSRKSAVGATVPFFQDGKAQLPNFQYETLVREGYTKNEIVFACIEEWATDIAEPDIIAVQGDETLDAHPALDLLSNPNPWLSFSALVSGIEMYLRIAGNAYIEKVRAGATNVVQLWLLRPDRVRIIPDRQKYIGGYEYRYGAETYVLPPEDVIHLKTRHPLDDFYGMPPLMAAAARTDIDNFMRDTVKSFLQNSGIPGGVLTLSQTLSTQEKELLRTRFRTDFGGRNAGNILLAENNASADWKPMAMPLGARGLVIPELDEIDEARIAMVYRVPLSLVGARLGMSSSSYGNRRSDREFFTEQQLVPEWGSLASSLTRGLMLEFRDAKTRIKFDLDTVRALSTDRDALHKRVSQTFMSSLTSFEESRDALGYPRTVKPDDIFLVPSNMVPMKASDLLAAEPAAPAPAPSPNGKVVPQPEPVA